MFAPTASDQFVPMELYQIKAFIDAMAASDLTELEASKDGWTIRLVRRVRHAHNPSVVTPTPRPPSSPQGADAVPPTYQEVYAPLPGIIHLQPSPNEPAFVVPGQAVTAGAILCIIEAMKTFNEIRAERDGIVEAVLVTSGTDVEAGQPLIRMT